MQADSPLCHGCCSAVPSLLHGTDRVSTDKLMSVQAWSYLLEAGHQEGLHVTALQENLMSQAPDVLQLPRLQPAGEKEFPRLGYCVGNSRASFSLGYNMTDATLIPLRLHACKNKLSNSVNSLCSLLRTVLSDS